MKDKTQSINCNIKRIEVEHVVTHICLSYVVKLSLLCRPLINVFPVGHTRSIVSGLVSGERLTSHILGPIININQVAPHVGCRGSNMPCPSRRPTTGTCRVPVKCRQVTLDEWQVLFSHIS